MNRPVRLLVVGREGQLARSLAEAAGDGVALSFVGRPALDLAAPETVETALGPLRFDLVLNAAAYTAVDRAEQEPELAFRINRDGTAALARAAARRGVPFVHISTDYVFDGRKRGSYTEDDAVAPQNVYGLSKRAGEVAALGAARALVIRTAWVHSPFGHNFVRTMLTRAAEGAAQRVETQRGEPLRVVDDQRGAPTYAPDLAAALLRIVPRILDGGPEGVYHLTNRGETTWCGFARHVLGVSRRLGGPWAEVTAIASAEYPTPARRPLNSLLDTGRFERAFGISLPDWTDGAEKCVARLLSGAGARAA
jgi:dTDP-4-dehydrorhamnose reductase